MEDISPHPHLAKVSFTSTWQLFGITWDMVGVADKLLGSESAGDEDGLSFPTILSHNWFCFLILLWLLLSPDVLFLVLSMTFVSTGERGMGPARDITLSKGEISGRSLGGRKDLLEGVETLFWLGFGWLARSTYSPVDESPNHLPTFSIFDSVVTLGRFRFLLSSQYSLPYP